MKLNAFLSLLFTVVVIPMTAQNMSFSAYLQSVISANPNALKTELIQPSADMEMRFARGVFDPKIQADFQQKKFDAQEYFSIGNASLSVPTYIGLKAEAGFQQNDGNYLNNQLITPANGLAYIGLSMPVLQGLKTDEARTAWQIAALKQSLATKALQWSVNELLYKASDAYAEYVALASEISVLDEGIINSQKRLEFVRNSYLVGDKAAIDTTEALLQIQVWEAERTELLRYFIFAQQQLNIFRWIETDASPDLGDVNSSLLENTLAYLELQTPAILSDTSAISEHPRVAISAAKITEAIFNRRLAAESLKPQLDIKYNFLRDAGLVQNEELNPAFNSRDFNWGLSFGFPLFLRKERAKIQLARIYEREAELNYDMTLRETETLISAAKLALQQSLENAERNALVVASYLRLLSAEEEKFSVGESSLFLLNTRESKWIESKRKLIKSNKEIIKSTITLIFAEGGKDWMKLMEGN